MDYELLCVVLRKMAEMHEWNPPDHSDVPWEPPLFSVAQRLKGIENFRGLEAEGACCIAEQGLAKSKLGWSAFRGIADEEVGHYQFIHCYQVVEHPARLGSLAYAVAGDVARRHPYVVKNERAGYAAAVNFCYQLQRLEGDADFVLSCRDMGYHLSLGHEAAAMYLRRMTALGYLVTCTPADKLHRRAASYHFLGMLNDGVLEPAIDLDNLTS